MNKRAYQVTGVEKYNVVTATSPDGVQETFNGIFRCPFDWNVKTGDWFIAIEMKGRGVYGYSPHEYVGKKAHGRKAGWEVYEWDGTYAGYTGDLDEAIDHAQQAPGRYVKLAHDRRRVVEIE